MKPNTSPRRLLWPLAATLLALGLLAWLLRDADVQALRQALVALPAWAWLAFAASMALSYLLRALRLHDEWHDRPGASRGACLRLVLQHSVAVLFVPLRLGELGYVWLARRLFDVSLTRAAGSLLWLRLQDVSVLGAISLAAALHMLGAAMPAALLAAASMLLLAALALGALRAGLLGWLERARPRWAEALRAAPERPAAQQLRGWSYALANWLLKIATLGSMVAALAPVGLPAGLRAAVGGEWAGALPLQGPAGLGSYEAAAWVAAGPAARGVASFVPAVLAVHLLALAWLLVLTLAVSLATRRATHRPLPAPASGLQPSPAVVPDRAA
jgi:hypothetical protein